MEGKKGASYLLSWRSTMPSDLLCTPASNPWASLWDRCCVARPSIPAITQWKWKQQHRCQWCDVSFSITVRMGVQYSSLAVCSQLKVSFSSTYITHLSNERKIKFKGTPPHSLAYTYLKGYFGLCMETLNLAYTESSKRGNLNNCVHS